MISAKKLCYNIGEERKVQSNETITAFLELKFKEKVKANEQVTFFKKAILKVKEWSHGKHKIPHQKRKLTRKGTVQ